MATSPEPPRGARFAPLLLLPLAWGTLFHRIGAAPLLDPDEPRYAAPARDIARGADPVLPRFNGQLRLNKPILYYWLAAAAYRVVGDDEAAGRLVSAVATVGAAGIAGLLARRAAGAWAGLFAAAVFLTTFYAPFVGRLASTDATLAFWVGLAIWFHARHGSSGFPRVRDAVPFWVALGLAALTKGPVGILIPLLVVLASIVGRGFGARVAALRPLPGLLVFLAVTSPWYAAVPLRIGWGPAWDLLWSETAERYFAGERHQEGLWFVPVVLLLGFLPWLAHLPLVALQVRARPAAARLPILWIAVVVLFFSVTRSKLSTYVASAFIPLSALAGMALAALPEASPRARRVAAGVVGALLGLLGLGSVAAPPLLRRAMPEEFPDLALGAIAAVALVAIGPAVWTLLRRPALHPLVFAAAAGGILFAAHSGPLDPFYARRSSHDAARAINAHSRGDERLIAYPRLYPGLVYYTGRIIDVPERRGELERRLASQGPVLVLLREKDLDDLSPGSRGRLSVLERLPLAGRDMVLARLP